MKTKIQSLLQQLNQGLVEREHVLKLAMLTTLAGENLVLVGPPGTGKSLVARRIANSLSHEGEDGAGYFEYLLTKFSTPEELFGPLSIAALKNDRFHRNTEGYLPTVRMAFLDEIFKASSSILNALLTVLNERVYHNGTEVQKVPLQALIAASNELPTDQEELAALYDRFLVRVFVDYVGANNLPRLFETTTEPTLRTGDMLSAADLARVRQAADQVVFEPALIQAVQDIWAAHKEAFKEDRREGLSDRRLKKVIHLMRVSAATNGREAVDLSDLMLLKDCLWSHADNAPKVRELVIKTLQCHSRQVPVALSDQSQAPAYELGADGKTLVLATMATALAGRSTSPARFVGRLDAVVKGYVGSGTADDPLLIQSVDDLMDLDRPEVGQRGYHFRQTVDLDISNISAWPIIEFNGHYDGQELLITDTETRKRWLFASIEESCMRNMELKNFRLAESAKKFCKLTACYTTHRLVLNAENCEIYLCGAGGNLIGNNASDCVISSCVAAGSLISETASRCVITSCEVGFSIASDAYHCEIIGCQSTHPLIWNYISSSTIEDCAVILDVEMSDCAEKKGGLASNVSNTSMARCFVMGEWNGPVEFSGAAITASSGSINHCAFGALYLNDSPLSSRIISNSVMVAMENNVTIDGFSDSRGGVEPIAAARFHQRFFEISLGWDFCQIWVWDDQENRPALRHVGAGETSRATINSFSSEQRSSVDLLIHQVKANMWL